MLRRNRCVNYGIGTDHAIISDFDFSYQFGSRTNQHSMTHARYASMTPTVPQSHPMINRAMFSQDHTRTQDDAAEMVNA